MKENTLLEMQNKIQAQSRIIQALINEMSRIQELSVGTFETVKLMPGYDKAIEFLKKEMESKVEQDKKEKADGVIESDTK
tara:strand:- start:415 stop:654 length:240 start_codon:yes stop_codon:yes gene_type:complete